MQDMKPEEKDGKELQDYEGYFYEEEDGVSTGGRIER